MFLSKVDLVMMCFWVTPLPIPNRMVKPITADGTAWETVWESKTLPGYLKSYFIKEVAFIFLKGFVLQNLQTDQFCS